MHKILTITSFLNRSNKFYRIFSVPKWLVNKLNSMSFPQFEEGHVHVVKKALKLEEDNFIYPRPISITEVKDSDQKEMELRSVDKTLNIFNDPVVISFVNKLWEDWNMSTFRPEPLNFSKCIELLPNTTSTGFPNFKKKSDEKEILYAEKLFSDFKSKKFVDTKLQLLLDYPSVIFHRYTPKLNSKKTKKVISYKIRQVFCLSYFITCLEVSLFYPFMDRFYKVADSFFTGKDTRVEISNKIQKVRFKAATENGVILCGDISGCDRSQSADSMKLFFSFIGSNYTNTEFKNFLALIKFLIFTPTVDSNGDYHVTNGTVSSGSYITTVINTFIVNMALNVSYFKLYGEFIPKESHLVQGDDFIILLKNPNDYPSFCEYMFDFNLKVKKMDQTISYPSEDILFLGFFWDVNGEPDQTNEWIFTRIIFPERYINQEGPERLISRYLSLIFLLKRSTLLFNCFLFYDDYLRFKLRYDSNPSFRIVNNNGQLTDIRINIQLLLQYGWRAYLV